MSLSFLMISTANRRPMSSILLMESNKWQAEEVQSQRTDDTNVRFVASHLRIPMEYAKIDVRLKDIRSKSS